MIDASDLRIFAEVARESGNHAVALVKRSVTKGSVNVKKQLRSEAEQSSSFKQIARTIDFDTESTSTYVETQIGPNTSIGGSASLGGIAYFGTSKPGGGTLPDPVGALSAEAPRLEAAIGDIMTEIFG